MRTAGFIRPLTRLAKITVRPPATGPAYFRPAISRSKTARGRKSESHDVVFSADSAHLIAYLMSRLVSPSIISVFSDLDHCSGPDVAEYWSYDALFVTVGICLSLMIVLSMMLTKQSK